MRSKLGLQNKHARTVLVHRGGTWGATLGEDVIVAPPLPLFAKPGTTGSAGPCK